MSSPEADVNWLLSAIAQAAAALVAIVGGLLVSRYVTLHAEQQAAKRRLDDLNRRMHDARSRAEEADEAWGETTARAFFEREDVIEGVAGAVRDGEPTLDAVLIHTATAEADLFDKDVYAKHFAEAAEEFKRAAKTITPLVPRALDGESWGQFKRGKGFVLEREPIWEWVYEELANGFHKSIQDERRRRAAGLSGIQALTAGTPLDIPRYSSGLDGGDSSGRLALLRDQASETEAEVRALEQEQRLAQETFDATRQPEGFTLALQVLSVLSVLGMGVPVTVMTVYPEMTLPWWGRAAVATVFFLGVYLLLRFLFVYASYLRGARDTLPKNAWGLLDPRPHRGA